MAFLRNLFKIKEWKFSRYKLVPKHAARNLSPPVIYDVDNPKFYGMEMRRSPKDVACVNIGLQAFDVVLWVCVSLWLCVPGCAGMGVCVCVLISILVGCVCVGLPECLWLTKRVVWYPDCAVGVTDGMIKQNIASMTVTVQLDVCRITYISLRVFISKIVGNPRVNHEFLRAFGHATSRDFIIQTVM